MTVETTCKFCGVPLSLQIDDDFAQLDGPLVKLVSKFIPTEVAALVKLATCDRCATLRERRRRIDEAIRKVCLNLAGFRMTADLKAKVSPHLQGLLVSYLHLVSNWTGQDVAWDDAFLESVLHCPDKYATVLGSMWKLAKAPKQGTLV